ncbi:MAG: nucleotidyltransferase substrate binding protein [Candidatus Liptonbacteria bacterium]|nr:nucleotidyltransferase substrate binding protein [Candidatus Liptonbacteria bacterium]
MKDFLDSFIKCLGRLEEILGKEKNITNRDAAIKRFEFTVELGWKSVQKFLREQEIICRSPRECLDEAFKFGIIDDDPKWLQMIKDRNLTTHTYDENLADEVYARFPGYLGLLKGLRDKLEGKAR